MFFLVIFFKTDIVYLIILIGGFKDVLFVFDGLYFGMIPNDSSIFFITTSRRDLTGIFQVLGLGIMRGPGMSGSA